MNKIFITFLVLIIVLGGYFFLGSKNVQAPTEETSQTLNTEVNDTDTTINEDIIITYSSTGYSPNTVTVKVGTTVTWKNTSSMSMWPASAMHPSHSVYSGTTLSAHCPDTDGTAFDACTEIPSGNSWSFTFDKQGTWKYHDHLKASYFGTVVVE